MVNRCAYRRVLDLMCYSIASFQALPSFPSTKRWAGPGHKAITTSETIFLFQLAQARAHNVLFHLVEPTLEWELEISYWTT